MSNSKGHNSMWSDKCDTGRKADCCDGNNSSESPSGRTAVTEASIIYFKLLNTNFNNYAVCTVLVQVKDYYL